jgi:hypothetical protein
MRLCSKSTLSRATSFPILLLIAWYERQSKKSGTSSFYETMSSVAEKLFDTLPRQIKRMSEWAVTHLSFLQSLTTRCFQHFLRAGLALMQISTL